MLKINIRNFNNFLYYDNLLLIFNLFGFANFLSLYFYKKNLIDSIILIKQHILRDFLLFFIFFAVFITVLKIIYFIIKSFKVRNNINLNENSKYRIDLNKIKNKAIVENNKVLYDFYESKKREIDNINKSFLLHLGYFVVFLLNWNFFVSFYRSCKENFMSLQCLFFVVIVLMLVWSFVIVSLGNINDEWNTYIDADIKRFIEKEEK